MTAREQGSRDRDMLLDYSFNELMSNINLLQDDDRYYNWYHGYSELLLPFWGRAKCNKLKDPKCGKVSLRYYFNTMAGQGNISTQYFGEKFDAEKVKKDIIFHITIGGNNLVSGQLEYFFRWNLSGTFRNIPWHH